MIEAMNEELEPLLCAEWELETGLRKLSLQQPKGRKPAWKWTEKTGKLSRRKGDGIDWYRYQTQVLIPKLIPFVKEC